VGQQSGIGLVELRTPNPLPVITDVDQRGDIVDLDLLWTQETDALFQVHTRSPPLMFPVWQAGVPIEMPFTVRDGTATWKAATSSDRFSEFGDRLDERNIEYEIESIHEFNSNRADRIMTTRQQEILLTALDTGYYATPREATLTEAANELDISKATCSETLHRAEGNILTWFADEYLTGLE
jgi:hypothetical protein